MRIFVGNLSFSAGNEDIQKIFEAYGEVSLVAIRKKSGKNSRGFGFVTMPNETEALAAIAALEGKDFMGRPMTVTPEREKTPKHRGKNKESNPSEFKVIVPQDDDVVVKPKFSPRKKSSRPTGTWEKRKGRGIAKGWKKNPGGIRKKFVSKKK